LVFLIDDMSLRLAACRQFLFTRKTIVQLFFSQDFL